VFFDVLQVFRNAQCFSTARREYNRQRGQYNGCAGANSGSGPRYAKPLPHRFQHHNGSTQMSEVYSTRQQTAGRNTTFDCTGKPGLTGEEP
jgi:hypothetical protein